MKRLLTLGLLGLSVMVLSACFHNAETPATESEQPAAEDAAAEPAAE